MKRMLMAVILVFLSSLLVGCSASRRQEESPLETPTVPPTVLPTQFESPLFDSPLPPSPPSISIAGPSFEIEKPVVAGASQVRGKGPYNVPIVFVDVTLTAKPLGSGIISSDGTFAIDISGELVPGHRVGIMAGMMEGATPVPSVEEYIENLKQFGGDGYKSVPYVGIIFDSCLVAEAP
jgi:hypothetical protein